MTRDQRKNLRIECLIPVLIRNPKIYPQEGWGIICDLSLGGVKLETRFRLTAGDVVYITFSMEKDYTFENLCSKVMHVGYHKGYSLAGVEFDDSVDKSYLRDALSRMINSRL